MNVAREEGAFQQVQGPCRGSPCRGRPAGALMGPPGGHVAEQSKPRGRVVRLILFDFIFSLSAFLLRELIFFICCQFLVSRADFLVVIRGARILFMTSREGSA